MNPAAPASAIENWRHLRTSLPGPENISSFLDRGSLLAWSEDRWFIAWGEPARATKPDRDRPSIYAADFFLRDEKPWRIYNNAAVVTPDSLAQLLEPRITARCWKPFDESAFGAVFGAVMNNLRAGLLQKAVPAVFETSGGGLTAEERAGALRSMANLPAGLMPYGCWDDEGGVIGASPELLFEDDGVEIHTVAVAGTARTGGMSAEMMDDPKERREHQLVLDDVEARLSQIGGVTRGATRLWRIGMLSHLRTDLRLTPHKKADFGSLVDLLHPTPAVGIAPRGDWRQTTAAVDGGPRGYFGAPFGLTLPGGQSRCIVAIRGVQWDRTTARCGAGCGLVPASELGRELAELRLKISATRGNLGL